MQVTELMTSDPIMVTPDESIATAIEIMQERNIRHLPVVDDQGELVGMLSDRDVRGLLLPYFQKPEMVETIRFNAGAPVATIMSSAPISIDMESDASLAAELMIDHRVGSIPVVDGDGALVGIISYVDLLRRFVDAQD